MIINNFLGGLGNQLFQISAVKLCQKNKFKFAINYALNHAGFGQGHHPVNTDIVFTKIFNH